MVMARSAVTVTPGVYSSADAKTALPAPTPPATSTCPLLINVEV